jgi:hypothetical protein
MNRRRLFYLLTGSGTESVEDGPAGSVEPRTDQQLPPRPFDRIKRGRRFVSGMRTGTIAAAILAASAIAGRSEMPAAPPAESSSDVQASPAHESVTGVDLPTLEQCALQLNPTLVQANAQIGISQGKARQAGPLPNPVFDLSGGPDWGGGYSW